MRRAAEGPKPRPLRRALLLLAAAATLLPVMDPMACRDSYCREPAPRPWLPAATRDWMAALPDDRRLSELTLPGTHDTGARFGGPLAECQSWSIPDQLAAGIRYLDIRCRQRADRFPIHHGMAYQHQDFADVLAACSDFLQAHPRECLVMRIKEEYTPEGNRRPFAETFSEYRRTSPVRWYTEPEVPRLGAVRGRIVLVTEHSRTLGGIPWASVSLQDDYQVPTLAAIEAKWEKVRAKLEEARGGSFETLYVNHCSGTGLGGSFPFVVAEAVNEKVYRHVAGQPGRYGIVIMDFPGERLIQALVRANFPETAGGARQPKN